jgi:molecular chaperone GrpE
MSKKRKKEETSDSMSELREKRGDEGKKSEDKKEAEEKKKSPSNEESRTEPQGQESELPQEENQEEDEESFESRILGLEEESRLLKDQLLRKQADFENFRKRLYREKEESIRYANQMLLLDIVQVIDDFERAIKSAEESKDFQVFHNGVALIEKQLVSTLENKWNLIRFDSLGEAFNPERHQAIAAEESDQHDIPTVVEDYQKGYLYHERVLRPAKVKVSQPGAAADHVDDQPAPEDTEGEQDG